MQLILASTSVYRRELLARLGLVFECVPPRVDESAIHALFDAASARELAEHLALAKAVAVSRTHGDATVLGSDQVCDGQILGKPGTPERAAEQLALLSGRQHQLITAVCLWQDGGTLRHTDITTLTMRELSTDEIARYVASDSPLDCAGSYKLESLGISLFEGIQSSLFEGIQSADHTAIQGLPLLAVCQLLRQAGYTIP
ncbi:MAG: Maf family protein [Pirellulaceae bacterium]|nr:Maf family protein [Pirellulaceae bacterium]